MTDSEYMAKIEADWLNQTNNDADFFDEINEFEDMEDFE